MNIVELGSGAAPEHAPPEPVMVYTHIFHLPLDLEDMRVRCWLPANDERDKPLAVGLDLGVPPEVIEEVAKGTGLVVRAHRNHNPRLSASGNLPDFRFDLDLPKLVENLRRLVGDRPGLVNGDELRVVGSHDWLLSPASRRNIGFYRRITLAPSTFYDTLLQP